MSEKLDQLDTKPSDETDTSRSSDTWFVRRLYVARDLRSALLLVPWGEDGKPTRHTPHVLWSKLPSVISATGDEAEPALVPLTPVWLLTPTLLELIRRQGDGIDRRVKRGELSREKGEVAAERYGVIADWAEREFAIDEVREARRVVESGEVAPLPDPPRVPRWFEEGVEVFGG